MEDKPTLKEYIRSRDPRYIKTVDGRYYANKNLPVTVTLEIMLFLLFTAPSFIMMCSNFPWHINIAFDFFIVPGIFLLFAPRLIYRFEKFELLQEGSEKYKKASAQARSGRTLTVIGLALFILVALMQGFTLPYLRSLTDTPKAWCWIHWTQGESQTLDTEEDDNIILIPREEGETAQISLFIFRTPYAPQLMIDGKTIVCDYSNSRISASALSDDYFIQHLGFPIPATDIHDGSVLTATCGKWSYEWTFVSGAP